MTFKETHSRFIRDQKGISSVEFAMVAVVFFMIILGTIDFGRALWEWNRATQATQAAVREAVVNDMVSDYLATLVGTSFAGSNVGDCVPTANVTSPVTCPSSPGGTNCSTGAMNTAAFDEIVAVAQAFSDRITPENVVVEYRYEACLGFTGNPVGPDVDPVVTVRLENMSFTFITPGLAQLVPTIAMPNFAASLSGEDHQS